MNWKLIPPLSCALLVSSRPKALPSSNSSVHWSTKAPMGVFLPRCRKVLDSSPGQRSTDLLALSKVSATLSSKSWHQPNIARAFTDHLPTNTQSGKRWNVLITGLHLLLQLFARGLVHRSCWLRFSVSSMHQQRRQAMPTSMEPSLEFAATLVAATAVALAMVKIVTGRGLAQPHGSLGKTGTLAMMQTRRLAKPRSQHQQAKQPLEQGPAPLGPVPLVCQHLSELCSYLMNLPQPLSQSSWNRQGPFFRMQRL
mmetsp:Transcript_42021/g.80390  ORF Transcript_42021/g.80390 Transcript_42021/m.80390 type:complete len:254 (+) Transcript_42021:88-849(+)